MLIGYRRPRHRRWLCDLRLRQDFWFWNSCRLQSVIDQSNQRFGEKRLFNRRDDIMAVGRSLHHFWNVPRHHQDGDARRLFVLQKTDATLPDSQIGKTVVEQHEIRQDTLDLLYSAHAVERGRDLQLWI